MRHRGSVAENSFTNKETRAKTLKEFKRCLATFYTDKMNFEPILARTKSKDIGYQYFKQFLISNCSFLQPILATTENRDVG